jgi:hypothetical protein
MNLIKKYWRSAALCAALLPSLGYAAPGDADETAKVKALAASVMAELSTNCPVKPVADRAAFDVCRKALFGDSLFRRSLKSYILWGRPPADANAALKDYKATQFGNDVFVGGYAPMWMFPGAYEFDYVPKEKAYRVVAPAGFRNEMDFGEYPYPFWHDAKKWSDYEDANTLTFWIDPKLMKIAQFTFFKRAEKQQVALNTKRHVPTFDGKWMWVDDKGVTQPAPALFGGIYNAKNPEIKALDETYRKFALSMRDADCLSCHVPNNPDHMRRSVLLQTPLHAASEIERVLRDVKHDRMPLDDVGVEKALDPQKKQQLIEDAEAFAKAVRAAKEWEAQQGTDKKVSGLTNTAVKVR